MICGLQFGEPTRKTGKTPVPEEFDPTSEDHLLQEAARALGVGGWRVDTVHGQIHLCARACALFGIAESGPRPAHEGLAHYVPEHRERLLEAYRRCVSEHEPYDVEFRIAPAEGGERWLRAVGRPEFDECGRVVAVKGGLLDIDAYKRRELELSEARRVAEQTDRAKSEFLSAMSHELRTPLNAIVGFAQLLNTDAEEEPATQRDYLRHILSAGWHLRDLVGDVLDLARIEAGKTSLTLEPVSARDLIQECMRLIRDTAAERGVSVRLEGCPEDRSLFVHADRLRAKQVVLNLLTNAIKYNREGGQVTLICSQADGVACIDVVDTGAGIAPGDQQALFQAFERLGREFGEIEGAGIGLALALKLSRLMGGDLELVASTPGQGSRFRLTLPTVNAVGWDRHRSPSLDPRLMEERSDDPALRLLAVEDNTINMLLLSGLVAKRTGVELLEASDAATGLELAQRYQPELMLIDMHLPDMDGFDLGRRLRRVPGLERVPMVALSADATDETRRRALEEGFDDYLLKPFEIEQLDALIREARLSKE